MSNAPDVSDKVRKRLKRQYRELKKSGGYRAVAAIYGLNVGHIFMLAIHGIEPSKNTKAGQEARYRLGLDPRPYVKPAWISDAVRFLSSREKAEPITGQRVYTRNRQRIMIDEDNGK